MIAMLDECGLILERRKLRAGKAGRRDGNPA